jgi:hypothetical protein
MNISRDVIIDLLPVYAAGEASADSRAAVEAFAERDADVRSLLTALQRAASTAAEPPSTLELEIVNRTRRVIARRSWTMALALLCTLLPFTFVFDGGDVTFFMLQDEPRSAWVWVAGAALWGYYWKLTRELRTRGLSS